jgi:MFS family permease
LALPRGWVVAALAVAETVSWGALYYAFAVLLDPMRRELGASTVELTGAFSVALLASAAAGPAVGRYLDRGRPRALMTGGAVAGPLVLVAWSQIESVVQLYVVMAALGLVMATVLYEPAFVVITQRFARRRHAALTALTTVGALASLIFAPLTDALVAAHGWRDALLVLAGIVAVVTVPLHAVALSPTPAAGGSARGAHAAARHPRASRPPGFVPLSAAFALGAFASTAVSVHLVTVLIDSGHTGSFAALAVGVVGVSQIPGRLALAVLGARARPRLPFVIFGLGAVALTVLAAERSTEVVLAAAVALGMSGGMATLLRASAPADLYGRAGYGARAGLTAAWTSGARALAPFAAAGLALLPGGQSTMLAALALSAAGAAVLGSRAIATATGAGAARRALAPPLPQAARASS